MEFSVNIKKIISLDAASFSLGLDNERAFDKANYPKLEMLKPMQRRRLSPYAKLAMHCALQITADETGALESIFSTRHGDIHKTSDMLHDIALGEDISPTAFSLSVHNAVSGLFTIFTQNTLPSTTVSAGKDTFMMALVEAYVRLNSGQSEQVLLVHCDQALPKPYIQYADELQIDHAIAMILTKDKDCGEAISFKRLEEGSVALNDDRVEDLPQGIAFSQWFEKVPKERELILSNTCWKVSR